MEIAIIVLVAARLWWIIVYSSTIGMPGTSNGIFCLFCFIFFSTLICAILQLLIRIGFSTSGGQSLSYISNSVFDSQVESGVNIQYPIYLFKFVCLN